MPFSEDTIPNGQNWIMQIRLAQGYSSALGEKGICAGIASMGVQAFLAQQPDIYITRLQKLYSLFYRALQITKTTYNIANDQDIFAFENTIKMQNEIKNLISQLPNGEKVDITAFFDGVEIYSHLKAFGNLFPNNSRPLEQMDSVSFQLAKSIYLDNVDMFMPLNFTGLYQLSDLENFLNSLQTELVKLPDEPFAIRLSNGRHRVSLSFKKETSEWIFINANILSKTHFKSVNQLAKYLLGSFGTSPTVILSTHFYTTTALSDTFNEGIMNWFNQRVMKNIHAMNLQKIQAIGSNGFSLLDLAVKNGDINTVKTFLNHIDLSQAQLDLSLARAVIKQDSELVELLLDHNANPNSKTKLTPNDTLLHKAARSGNREIIKLIVDHGANVNARDSALNSPLYYAVINQHIELVHYFLLNGAEIDSQKYTLMFEAKRRKSGEIISLLNYALDSDFFNKEISRLSKIHSHHPDRQHALQSLKLVERLKDILKTAKYFTTFILLDKLAFQLTNLATVYHPSNPNRQQGLSALNEAVAQAYRDFSMGNHDMQVYFNLRKKTDHIAYLAKIDHAKNGRLVFFGTKSTLERKINEAINEAETEFKPQPFA